MDKAIPLDYARCQAELRDESTRFKRCSNKPDWIAREKVPGDWRTSRGRTPAISLCEGCKLIFETLEMARTAILTRVQDEA